MFAIETKKEITTSGTEMYYENGVLSRPDGPAIIRPGVDEEWWMNGMLHRHDPATPDVLYPAVCRWTTMQFEYWIKGVFICRNPHEGDVIIEWDGWVKDGQDNSAYPSTFKICYPKPKYKSLYTGKNNYRIKRKLTEQRAYGCITHYSGDEESGT